MLQTPDLLPACRATRCLVVRRRHAGRARLPPRRGRLVAQARALMAAGCDGIALFGTTGEGAEFSVEDRTATLEAVLAAGLPAARLIVSVGRARHPRRRAPRRATPRRRASTGCCSCRPASIATGITEDATFRYYDAVIARAGARRPPALPLPLPRHLGRAGHAAGGPPPRRAAPGHHRRREGLRRRPRLHRRARPPLLASLDLHRQRDPPARPHRAGRARGDLRPRQRHAAADARADRRAHRLRPPGAPARAAPGRRHPLAPPVHPLGQGGHRRRARRRRSGAG